MRSDNMALYRDLTLYNFVYIESGWLLLDYSLKIKIHHWLLNYSSSMRLIHVGYHHGIFIAGTTAAVLYGDLIDVWQHGTNRIIPR